MNIGLIDVDCHASKKKWGATIYPNIAMGKIARFHKQQGDNVEFAMPFSKYDIVYKSKIFNFSPDCDFDKVLVRLTNDCVWMPKFFSYYDTNPKIKYYPFVIIDNIGYPQCIPYEDNKHLLGTTNDCNDYYKIWE